MVETISALPLSQGSGTGSSAQPLEPGTELKARVESNLPGGVVRLATADAKIDLRVAAPLPVDAEVTVTVSGSRQQPAVTIAVDKGTDRSQPAAQSGAAAGQASQARGPVDPVTPGISRFQPVPPSQSGLGYGGAIRTTPAGAHLVQVLAPGGGAPAAGNASGSVPGGQAPVLPNAPAAPPATQGPAPTAVVNSPSPATAAPLGGGAASGPPAGAAASASGNASAAPGELPRPVGPSPVASAVQGPAAGGGPSAASQAQTGASLTSQPFAQDAAAQSSASSSQDAAPQGATGRSAPLSGGAGAPPTSAPGAQPSPGQVSPGPVGGGPVPTTGSSAAAGPLPQSGPASGGAPPGQAGPPSPTVAAPAGTLRSDTAGSASIGSGQAGLNTSAGTGREAVTAARPASQPAAGLEGHVAKGVTATAPSGTSTPPEGGNLVSTSRLQADAGALGAQRDGLPSRTSTTLNYQQLSAGPAVRPEASPSPTKVPQGPASQLASGLRQPLAEQQAGLTGLFAQVGSLASAQAAGKVSLPDPVVKAMQQILGLRLNTSGPPTAASLQEAVRLSGQFREAQLALPGTGTGASGSVDLKSALLSFRALLQNLGALPEIVRPAGQPPAPSRQGSPQGQPPQAAGGYWAGAAPQNLQALLKETDQSLARLRMTQLANTGLAQDSGPQSASRPMDLVLELPLALGQETAVLQMQIGRDGAGNRDDGDAEPGWRLRFALDLTATGPLEAAVSLRGGGTFASLWIDRKDTFDRLSAIRETMEASFADAGLDLKELRLIRGLPPRTAALYGARVDRQS